MAKADNLRVQAARETAHVAQSAIELVTRVRDPRDHRLRRIRVVRFAFVDQTGRGHQMDLSRFFAAAHS